VKPRREHVLAATALHYALAEDWPRAQAAVKTLDAEFGGEALEFAMRAWCDTLLNEMPEAGGKPIRWGWVAIENGQVGFNTQDLPPRNRWAAHMLSARQARDIDTWNALLEALPDDGSEIASHIIAVLETATLTLGRIRAANA
jgi:hypothetical protein